MYQIIIIFLVIFLLFGIIRPKCARSTNPFRGSKFSWMLALLYSSVITAVISGGLYLLIPSFKKSIDIFIGMRSADPPPQPPSTKSSSDLLQMSPPAVNRRTSTDDANVKRLSIRPFSV